MSEVVAAVVNHYIEVAVFALLDKPLQVSGVTLIDNEGFNLVITKMIRRLYVDAVDRSMGEVISPHLDRGATVTIAAMLDERPPIQSINTRPISRSETGDLRSGDK
jgi:hypothetical protein